MRRVNHYLKLDSVKLLANALVSIASHLDYWNSLFNQSINQTSIAPISPAKPGSVARQPNQSSTAKSKKQFCEILYGIAAMTSSNFNVFRIDWPAL